MSKRRLILDRMFGIGYLVAILTPMILWLTGILSLGWALGMAALAYVSGFAIGNVLDKKRKIPPSGTESVDISVESCTIGVTGDFNFQKAYVQTIDVVPGIYRVKVVYDKGSNIGLITIDSLDGHGPCRKVSRKFSVAYRCVFVVDGSILSDKDAQREIRDLTRGTAECPMFQPIAKNRIVVGAIIETGNGEFEIKRSIDTIRILRI